MILTEMSGQEDPGRVSGVAILGLSGRFPGAGGPSEFWANLRAGRESITALAERPRLDAGEAVGDDIAGFDAAFFGMSVPAASAVDPQHRLFLECAWEAFEHAGYVGERVQGPVAVFAAPGPPFPIGSPPLANHQAAASGTGPPAYDAAGARDVLATLVSRTLNLTGPSMDVQTAGASSLAAVHLACQSLLNGECDMALAGGSTVYADENGAHEYRGEDLSPDGHCRPFNARATGTVLASAVACVVLKRLEDAVRDGDHVVAVIRGSAINNTGARPAGEPGVLATCHGV